MALDAKLQLKRTRKKEKYEIEHDIEEKIWLLGKISELGVHNKLLFYNIKTNLYVRYSTLGLC